MSAADRYDVVIAGSGFGGTILARALQSRGRRVLLVEKGEHPRFALGESSTPLAALSLERLAADYGLGDLHGHATWGRWQRNSPELRCGLKRGFTFCEHVPGEAGPPRVLAVAASPNDEVADTHWMRSDFDARQVERALAEGVEVRQRTAIVAIDERHDHSVLTLRSAEGERQVATPWWIDATGRRQLARRLGLVEGDANGLRTRSSLVYSHFEGVGEPSTDRGLPYPPQWSAVHHLIEEGWIYELRFDDGRVSAGALLRQWPLKEAGEVGEAAEPRGVWAELIARYPHLQARYGRARPTRAFAAVERVQHRLAAAAGRRWLALPHTYTFIDPLFSTGIAWTLRAVERVADLVTRDLPRGGPRSVEHYARLLAAEADAIDALVSTSYRTTPSLESFQAVAAVYFAVVSWSEARERLCSPEAPAWEGFLGCEDPLCEPLLGTLVTDLERYREDPAQLVSSTLDRLAPIDIAGLDRYLRTGAVPVDLDVLVERSAKLGLERDEVRARLPLLRGEST